MGKDVFEITVNCIKLVLIFLMMVQAVPILVWVERRGSAFIQNRFGPNRVGPLGLTQLLADAVKFLMKEDFIPQKAVRTLYYLAPVFALIPGAVAFASIPMSVPLKIGGYEFLIQGYQINVGIVFILGVSSLAAYTILMAGWGSSNKYSLMGALRASAQIISYELALGLSIVGVILLYGTFNLHEMIASQTGHLHFNFFGYTVSSEYLPNWGIFYQPLGAILFFSAAFAESNRLPFDLAEGEAELVAGFHTEYGGFKMLMFFIGEYAHMMIASGLMATFFFGGYALPVPGWTEEVVRQWLGGMVSTELMVNILTTLIFFVSFNLKLVFFLWVFIWVRWTLPRFRYDQLMDLGWKTMLPWALFNTVLTAVMIFFGNVNF
jgi:NADH-quinone oxidoreductase subunit H